MTDLPWLLFLNHQNGHGGAEYIPKPPSPLRIDWSPLDLDNELPPIDERIEDFLMAHKIRSPQIPFTHLFIKKPWSQIKETDRLEQQNKKGIDITSALKWMRWVGSHQKRPIYFREIVILGLRDGSISISLKIKNDSAKHPIKNTFVPLLQSFGINVDSDSKTYTSTTSDENMKVMELLAIHTNMFQQNHYDRFLQRLVYQSKDWRELPETIGEIVQSPS